ncbi:hypothetical protein J6590_027921 [Homalodisca vitripennis]|nr:hypothetical protein J6590_027921 [Homalodisca vitripennis]
MCLFRLLFVFIGVVSAAATANVGGIQDSHLANDQRAQDPRPLNKHHPSDRFWFGPSRKNVKLAGGLLVVINYRSGLQLVYCLLHDAEIWPTSTPALAPCIPPAPACPSVDDFLNTVCHSFLDTRRFELIAGKKSAYRDNNETERRRAAPLAIFCTLYNEPTSTFILQHNIIILYTDYHILLCLHRGRRRKRQPTEVPVGVKFGGRSEPYLRWSYDGRCHSPTFRLFIARSLSANVRQYFTLTTAHPCLSLPLVAFLTSSSPLFAFLSTCFATASPVSVLQGRGTPHHTLLTRFWGGSIKHFKSTAYLIIGRTTDKHTAKKFYTLRQAKIKLYQATE